MSYKLTNTDTIIRLSDKACIPTDPANTDYQEYIAWISEGNTPELVDPPTLEQLKQAINAVCQSIILDRFSLIHQLNVANGLYADKGMKAWIADMVSESNRCTDLIDMNQEAVPMWPEYVEVV